MHSYLNTSLPGRGSLFVLQRPRPLTAASIVSGLPLQAPPPSAASHYQGSAQCSSACHSRRKATTCAAVSWDRSTETASSSGRSTEYNADPQQAYSSGSPLTAPARGSDWSPPEAGDAASRDFAIAMAKVASDTKGEDITVLHVAPLVYWTSYMAFVTVFSKPQLNAILAKIEKEAAEEWDRRILGSNPGRGEWEVLDYGDVVVHVFTAEQREYYDLESFYGAAEEVALPFLAEEARDTLGWQKSY